MKTEEKNTCLYMHTRKTDGRIFYIGIGSKKRSKSKSRRNKHWRNTVNKYGYNITILLDGLTWKKACNLEIKMIAFYGRKDKVGGCLVNKTDGGEGAKGIVISEETKEKMSERMIGENNPNFGKNFSGKNNPNFGNTGKNNPNFGKQRLDHSIKMSGENNSRAKKVSCNITGKIYGCIKDAAEDIGVNYGTLRDYLRGKYTNKTSLRYV